MMTAEVVAYPRFNEAAALLPRRSAVAAVHQLIADVASMRPRHYCRGDQSAAVCSIPPSAALQ